MNDIQGERALYEKGTCFLPQSLLVTTQGHVRYVFIEIWTKRNRQTL